MQETLKSDDKLTFFNTWTHLYKANQENQSLTKEKLSKKKHVLSALLKDLVYAYTLL